MTLKRLQQQIERLLADGVSPSTQVSVDLTSFDERRKIKEWTVMSVKGLEVECIDLCDEHGNPAVTHKGQTKKQMNVLVK